MTIRADAKLVIVSLVVVIGALAGATYMAIEMERDATHKAMLAAATEHAARARGRMIDGVAIEVDPQGYVRATGSVASEEDLQIARQALEDDADGVVVHVHITVTGDDAKEMKGVLDGDPRTRDVKLMQKDGS